MRFEHPEWIWLALLTAALAAVLVFAWQRRRQRALSDLGSTGMLERLTNMDLSGAPLRRASLVAPALGLAGLALAGPQWGAQEREEQTRALSVVLALDISESMWAEDVRPSRLEQERLEARRLATELEGHRVGLVAFAGAAYVLTPLTTDRGAIELYLDALDPTIAGTPGSSIANAIASASELLKGDPSESGDRAIVILTDGEAHDDPETVVKSARAAAARGIHIYAIGIGKERGEPIPRHDRLGERIGGFKRDSEGEVVLSRLTRELAAEAARITSGFWARADEGGVTRVLTALSQLERGDGRVTRGVEWIPRFQWFVAAALLLLIMDWAWAWRRVR
ncbi:MAG: VWA domain-containing protein [Gemmatimonadota bacterium]